MIPFELPVGVRYAPTKASRSANWRETNLMRWVGGAITPIGGWEKISYNIPFASRIREIHSWLGNDGTKYTAYLCEQHCYVEVGDTLLDISPTVPIVPPYDGSVLDGGYGEDLYNYDEYGTPRPEQPRSKSITPSYTLDNWGDQLLAMTSADGRLMFWDPATPSTPLTAVTGAPTANRTFIVTPERHVMLFGYGGDSRSFCWSDQEDYNNWNFADVTSKAGFFGVEPASPIIAVCKSGTSTVFFTSVKAYVIRFVGLPYVYAYEEIADNLTPISPHSVSPVSGGCIWTTGVGGFWMYNGSSVTPIECPVLKWATDNMDSTYSRYEGVCVNVATFSEMWWFFPSQGSRFNDRYIMYHYGAGWWAMGQIGRSAGFSASYNSFNIMADGVNAYKHESSNLYDGAPELPWAETFSFQQRDGAIMGTVSQMIPDIDQDASNIKFNFKYRDNRSRNAEITTPDLSIRANGYVDVRATGRDFRMRVGVKAQPVLPFTLGNTLLDIKKRGSR